MYGITDYIRFALTAGLIIGIFIEAGIFTALFATCVAVSHEQIGILLNAD